MRNIKILIACGSGIATSSFVAVEIENLCKNENIACSISKVRLVDVPLISKDYDICFTASKYSKKVSCPTFSVSGLITGVGVEQLKEKIVDTLIDINKKVNNY